MEQYEIYPVLSISLNINNVIFYLVAASIITIAISSKGELVQGVLNESLYRTILVMTTDYIGSKFTTFFPLIYTVFHLILFTNLIGMVPYTSCSSVEIIITLSIAFTLLIAVLIRGFKSSHGMVLLAAFIPAGTPLALVPLMIVLEIVAYVTRCLSLGLR
jgi:F-type H+-transporting ATPase subunit a